MPPPLLLPETSREDVLRLFPGQTQQRRDAARAIVFFKQLLEIADKDWDLRVPHAMQKNKRREPRPQGTPGLVEPQSVVCSFDCAVSTRTAAMHR